MCGLCVMYVVWSVCSVWCGQCVVCVMYVVWSVCSVGFMCDVCGVVSV